MKVPIAEYLDAKIKDGAEIVIEIRADRSFGRTSTRSEMIVDRETTQLTKDQALEAIRILEDI